MGDDQKSVNHFAEIMSDVLIARRAKLNIFRFVALVDDQAFDV